MRNQREAEIEAEMRGLGLARYAMNNHRFPLEYIDEQIDKLDKELSELTKKAAI